MKKIIPIWPLGLGVTLTVIVVPLLVFLPKNQLARDNPQAHIQPTAVAVSHADIVKGPFGTPQEVTRECWYQQGRSERDDYREQDYDFRREKAGGKG